MTITTPGGTPVAPDCATAETVLTVCGLQPDAAHHRQLVRRRTRATLERLGRLTGTLDMVWTRSPSSGPGPTWRALSTARDDAVAALADDPLFSSSVVGLVGRLRASDPDGARRHLRDVVASTAPAVPELAQLPVPLQLDDEGRRGLGARLRIDAGAARARSTVLLTGAGGGMTVQTADGADVAVRRREGLPFEDTTIVVEDQDEQLARFLGELRDDADSAAAGVADLHRDRRTGWDRYAAGLRLCAETWPAMAAEMAATVTMIVPIRSEGKAAFSNTAWQGAVFLEHSDPDPLFVLERLVHESSHLRLNAVMDLVELHCHPWSDRVESPFRRGLRPVTGLFHGAFVFTRVALAMARVSRSGSYGHQAGERVRALLGQIEPSLHTLDEAVRLTPPGRALLDEITEACARLAREFPGPAAAVDLPAHRRAYLEEH